MTDYPDLTVKDIKTGQELTVKTNQINILCGKQIEDFIPVPGQNLAIISPQDTVRFIDVEITQEIWDELGNLVANAFNDIFNNEKLLPKSLDQMKRSSLSDKHVAGLIFLTMMAIIDGKTPFYRFPETYLHPDYVVRLTDFLMNISEGKMPGVSEGGEVKEADRDWSSGATYHPKEAE